MAELLVLHYPKCTTCKRALKWLDEHDVTYAARDIKMQNPTRDELAAWHRLSGLPIRRLFNTSGQLYRQLGLKDKLPTMTEDECYDLLATDGMLVKRPLVIGDDFVLVGCREADWQERLLK